MENEINAANKEIKKLCINGLIEILRYSLKTIAENYDADTNKLKICLDEIKTSLLILKSIKSFAKKDDDYFFLIRYLEHIKERCDAALFALNTYPDKFEVLRELQLKPILLDYLPLLKNVEITTNF